MKKSVPEFEGQKTPKHRVFSESILTNFREDEKEQTRLDNLKGR